jgi:hypothetical protein
MWFVFYPSNSWKLSNRYSERKLKEIFNSDAVYGGSGIKNGAKLAIEAAPYDGRD